MQNLHSDVIVFLKKTSDFFDETTTNAGRNICPKHKVEHTGKTAYSIAIDLELFSITKDEQYLARAKKRALRIVDLQRQEFGGWIFTPDGDPKWNCSNGMIDSGAAVDVLMTFIQKYPTTFSADEQRFIKSKTDRVCDTYFLGRVEDKPHPNQRLWGATGLASAYKEESKPIWKKAVLDSVENSLQEMRPDGSIPYVTDYKKNGYPIGIVDTTPYYHSRHIAFAWYALEQTDSLSEEMILAWQPGVDFLIAMYQEDGQKNISLETKRWYFLSDYEIASNSYDVYVLCKYYRATGDKRYAWYAQKALCNLLAHQNTKNVIDNEKGEINFQCPYFWNSHIAWVARVLPEIEDVAKINFENFDPSFIGRYQEAGVTKVVKTQYAAIFRDTKQPCSLLWGPGPGAGTLIYFGVMSSGFKNSQPHPCFSDAVFAGNFYIRHFNINIVDHVKKYKKEFRALLFYILVELRSQNWRNVLLRSKALFSKLFVVQNLQTSYFDPRPTLLQCDAQCYSLNCHLADFAGVIDKSIIVERHYDFTEGHIDVKEVLRSQSRIRRLHYKVPAMARAVLCDGKDVRLGRKRIVTVKNCYEAAITYRLGQTT